MKRTVQILSLMIFLTASFQIVFAQDDQYYDPSKDAGKQHSEQQYDNNNQNNSSTSENNYSSAEQTDKTDGYGNSADRYDPRDSYTSSNYSTDAYYDEDDYDTYSYTTRLHRYYRPNYGVNYYSYWFTPSFYWGYNSWNTTYYVSYSPWYQDPWWKWNRRHHTTVIVYDPFYDPYWDWNFGWNSCYYYNSWSNPYWGYNSCRYYGGFNSWGWNGWGYNNGGFCSGYYSNYGNGYYNGYNNGYWNGYYDGWNSAYGYGGYYDPYYYYGHHRNGGTGGAQQQNNNRIPVTTASSNPTPKPTPHGEAGVTEIPREGITKPFVSNVKPNASGVNVNANTQKPYLNASELNSNTVKPSVNIKPSENNVGVTKGNDKSWEPKNENTLNGNVIAPKQYGTIDPNVTGKHNAPGNMQPNVKQSNNEPDDWRVAPPDRWSNKPNVQHEQQVQQLQPKQNDWNNAPLENNRWNSKPRYEEPRVNQQPNYAPRQQQNNNWGKVEPRNEQPRFEQKQNFEPREQPRMNVQPRQEFQQQQNFQRAEPRSNFSAPQQRNFNGGGNSGGGFKRH